MYEIKGKMSETVDGPAVNVHLLVENASTLQDAIQMVEEQGVEPVAGFLSRYKEYFQPDNNDVPTKYFKLTAQGVYADPETGKKKKTKYDILLAAEDFEHANKKANDVLVQGYDMTKCQIKEVKIDGII